MSILLTVCGGLVAFFEIQLLTKFQKTFLDKILSIWFAFVLLQIFLIGLNYQGDYEGSLIIYGFDLVVSLVHAPLLWAFVLLSLNEKEKLPIHFIRHFSILLIPFAILLTYGFFPETWNHYLLFALKFIFPIQLFIYLYWSFQAISKFQKKEISIKINRKVKWLKILCSCFIILAFSNFYNAIANFLPLNYLPENDTFVHLTSCLVVLVSFFFMLRNTSHFSPQPISISNFKNENPTSSYLQKEKDVAEFQLLFETRIQPLFENEKAYLHSDLTLFKLAQQLSIPTHQLSKAIKLNTQSGFHDFINAYRVEEVKRKISTNDWQRKTLLAIAFESGFNSKASFNRAFKKFTGSTPSNFIKEKIDKT